MKKLALEHRRIFAFSADLFSKLEPQVRFGMKIKRVRKDSMTDVAHYYREASILYLSDHANVAPFITRVRMTNSFTLRCPTFRRAL